MSYNKTFESLEFPLMFKKGIDLVNYTMTITDNNGSNYDYTGITDINLFIYNHADGTLLKTLSMTNNITVSSNIITFNVNYDVDLGLDISDLRYYELIWEDSSNRPLGISYGDFKII